MMDMSWVAAWILVVAVYEGGIQWGLEYSTQERCLAAAEQLRPPVHGRCIPIEEVE